MGILWEIIQARGEWNRQEAGPDSYSAKVKEAESAYEQMLEAHGGKEDARDALDDAVGEMLAAFRDMEYERGMKAGARLALELMQRGTKPEINRAG